MCHLNPLESRLVKTIFPKFNICWEFLNWDITSGIRAWAWNLLELFIRVFFYIDLPPLEIETGDLNSEKGGSGEVSSFYKEIKEKLGLGDMDNKENNEDLKTFIQSSLEGMTKHFM